MYVFTVGGFGVLSIAYWARLGGAAARAVHHVMDNSDELGLLLMAADMKLELHDDHTVGLNRERIAALRSIGHSHDRSCSAGNCSVM